MDEQLLALLVPHDLPESPQLILCQIDLAVPSIQQNLVYIFLQPYVEVCL